MGVCVRVNVASMGRVTTNDELTEFVSIKDVLVFVWSLVDSFTHTRVCIYARWELNETKNIIRFGSDRRRCFWFDYDIAVVIVHNNKDFMVFGDICWIFDSFCCINVQDDDTHTHTNEYIVYHMNVKRRMNSCLCWLLTDRYVGMKCRKC